ncbi:MAG TPA: OmpH family outer membrane protein [Alphaproteobacteria bacterium]|nr:OmpH family outer membrane protein [Alphaproteobacteria bacterium]
MKSFTTIAAIAALAMTLAGPAAAQKAPEPAIAIIDTQVLLEKAEAAKAARAQIEKLRTEMVQALAAQQQELRLMSQNLARERASLSEDVFQQRMREALQKNADLQKAGQEQQAKLNAASRAVSQKIEGVVHDIVDELKKEHRYALVVVRSSTMGKPTVPDITETVLGRLDRRLPTVEVTLQ